nr:MAG TPA: hypothetical protein [Caudoviricetes sp.]
MQRSDSPRISISQNIVLTPADSCHHSRHDFRDDILMQFFCNLFTALCYPA